MDRDNSSKLMIGTCGWSYPEDWKSVFYPENLKSKDYLEFYSQIFNTVEIDSSFYHTPSLKIVQNWGNRTSSEFRFTTKLPQEVTHKNKLILNRIKPFLNQHFMNFKPLENQNKLIGHLIQLPPSFEMNKHWDRLESFLNYWLDWKETQGKDLLNKNLSALNFHPIIEFRNKSWIRERTFALLRAYEVTYCAVVEPIVPPRMDITTPELFYLRFHGYGDKPFWKYNFSDSELKKWADKLNESYQSNKKTLHVAYFNNHYSGYAVKNALDILPKLNLTPKTNLSELKVQFSKNLKQQNKLRNLKNQKAKHKSLDNWFS